jgi:hypothetical protein
MWNIRQVFRCDDRTPKDTEDKTLSVLTPLTRQTQRLGSIALIILGCFLGPLGPHTYAEGTCTLQEYTLPSTSYLQLTHNASGYVVHLQRSSYQYTPTVLVWEQGQFTGAHYLPVDVYDIQVRLEGRYVLETWMGKVRQVYKEVSIARACAESWTGIAPW